MVIQCFEMMMLLIEMFFFCGGGGGSVGQWTRKEPACACGQGWALWARAGVGHHREPGGGRRHLLPNACSAHTSVSPQAPATIF